MARRDRGLPGVTGAVVEVANDPVDAAAVLPRGSVRVGVFCARGDFAEGARIADIAGSPLSAVVCTATAKQPPSPPR